jgi:hypothetical protein
MNRFKKSCLGAIAFLMPLVSCWADDAAEIRLLKERLQALEAKLSAQEKVVEEKTTSLATEISKSRIGSLIPEKAELRGSGD